VQVSPPPVQMAPPGVQVSPPPVQMTPPRVQVSPPPVQMTPPGVQVFPPAPCKFPLEREGKNGSYPDGYFNP
jgi:hypothetical protein